MKNILSLFVTSLLMILHINLAQAAEDNLETAFMKEYAFLESQKNALLKDVQDLKQGSAKDIAEQNVRIEKLEQRLATAQFEAEQLQRKLNLSEDSIAAGKTGIDALENLFKQAEVSLKEYGYKIPADTEGAQSLQALDEVYAQGVRLLQELSSVRVSKGDFFLENGEQVSGKIIKVGNIASYGVSDNGSGALVPVGDGLLGLKFPVTATTAQNLFAGRDQQLLDMFIYEDINKSVDDTEAKTVLDIVNSGGTIAWLIVALGVVTLLAVALRVHFLRKASGDSAKLLPEVEQLVREGRIDSAQARCQQSRGAIARILMATLRNLDRDRDHIEDIISESILHENGYFSRYGAFIIIVAGVAPLLGLLGTVTGMISTFDVITQFGTGDPKLLSGGISTALVTTQLGLVVAIPALVFGNLLNGWANRIKDQMEKSALRVINLQERSPKLKAAA